MTQERNLIYHGTSKQAVNTQLALQLMTGWFLPSNVVIKAELISAAYQQQLDLDTAYFVQNPKTKVPFESSRKWIALLLSPKNIRHQISEFYEGYNQQYTLRRGETGNSRRWKLRSLVSFKSRSSRQTMQQPVDPLDMDPDAMDGRPTRTTLDTMSFREREGAIICPKLLADMEELVLSGEWPTFQSKHKVDRIPLAQVCTMIFRRVVASEFGFNNANARMARAAFGTALIKSALPCT